VIRVKRNRAVLVVNDASPIDLQRKRQIDDVGTALAGDQLAKLGGTRSRLDPGLPWKS
jgi:hypothetical protein